MNNIITNIAVPPGETIKEQLDFRDMSQKEFAVRMDMSQKHISKLINGEVQLTHDMANKLEMVLGIPAKFWNNLESIYRERLLKIEAENSIRNELDLISFFPYTEMAHLGWIPDTGNAKDKVFNLRQFFEVVDLSLLENEHLTGSVVPKIDLHNKNIVALITWVQKAKLITRDNQKQPSDTKKIIELLPKIKDSLDRKPKYIKNMLTECGVDLIVVPKLKNLTRESVSFSVGRSIVIETIPGKESDPVLYNEIYNDLSNILSKRKRSSI